MNSTLEERFRVPRDGRACLVVDNPLIETRLHGLRQGERAHLDDWPVHYPAIRYILLHSFAHAVIRQRSIECGYTAASIRERIYSRPASEGAPMAGVLIYTAAPDSEGTLGGLVSLGEPDMLGRHLDQALEAMRL